MEQYDVMRLALVLAVQAEIEGMKIDNALHTFHNTPLKYVSNDFNIKAEKLRDLAYAHNEQL